MGQDGISLGAKKQLGKKSARRLRYWRNVGLSFATPKEAKEGNYVDKKCPFTGTISIRRNYLHYIKKFNRFEKRHSNMAVHCSPCFEPKEGDIVTVGQCRPLSKTVRFNVLKVEKNQIFGNPRKVFMLF